jgi:3,4-dihydroxy-2-butanone 4-phosphate synthase
MGTKSARRQGSERLHPPDVTDALADIAAGKFVVVTDDADRENEGDLIMAADRMTEEAMAFMVSLHTFPAHAVSFVVLLLSYF